MEENIMEDDIKSIIKRVEEKKDIVNSDCEELLDFPSLDASIPFSRKNAIKPIYFIPTMQEDRSNILAFNKTEPFNYVAIPQAQYHLSLMKEKPYMDDLLEIIKNQCSAMIANNAAIILNNDVLYVLEDTIIDHNLFYECYNVELVGNRYNIATGDIYNIDYQLRDAFARNKMDECGFLLCELITKVKNDLARSFSNRAHTFTMEILNRRLIDIDKLFKKFSDDVTYDKYSACMQKLHAIIGRSVGKICDIAELALVSAFYQLTDTLAEAKKLGIASTRISTNSVGFNTNLSKTNPDDEF